MDDIRLDISNEQRTVERTVYKIKLDNIRQIYGDWNFTDMYTTPSSSSSNNNNDNERPTVDWLTVTKKKGTKTTNSRYDSILLGEIDPSDFPNNVWQTDDIYIYI